MPGGTIHKRPYVALRQGQITDEKRDGACPAEGTGQRHRVIAGAGVDQIAFDAMYSLIGKSLQPEYQGMIRTGQQPLIILKPNDVRPPGEIATQHALDVPPCTFQVTQGKQRHADQTVAYWPVGRIGRCRRTGAKSFRQPQRLPIAAARAALAQQSPNRPTTTILIVSPFPRPTSAS